MLAFTDGALKFLIAKASISLSFTAEYVFESHANVIDNKPTIVINVDYPPCLSGTDYVHQIVDPLMANTMLEMKARFSDIAQTIQRKVVIISKEFLNWLMLCS